MNQRYYQSLTQKWWKWDLATKIATASFATFSFGLSVASLFQSSNLITLTWVSFVVSLLTACAAIVLNVVPFGSWEKDAASLYHQWTDLREEVDCLAFDLGKDEPSRMVVSILQRLEGRRHRICGTETFRDDVLWKDAQARERRYRGDKFEPVQNWSSTDGTGTQ
jgi:hypothetical protein